MSEVNWFARLGHWRSVLTGWQLGTRATDDPESAAVSDHRELSLALRAELNALKALLVGNRVFTEQQFADQLQLEAKRLCELYEGRFPGFKAVDQGLQIAPHIAADTTQGWKP